MGDISRANEPNLFEQIKCRFLSADRSSLILKKIVTRKRLIAKLFWLTFLITSGVISIYLSIQYISSYLVYDVHVNTEVIYESPTYFPAITFCNLNPYFQPRAKEFVENLLDKNNLSHFKNLKKTPPNSPIPVVHDLVNELIKASLAANVSLSAQYRYELGFSIDEMLISCSFNGLECTAANFTFFESHDFRNCFTFNSALNSNGSVRTIHEIIGSGPLSGLHLELYVGTPDEHFDFIYRTGAYIVVHNQSAIPIIETVGSYVASGSQTNLAIKRTFLTKLGEPYSKCKTYFQAQPTEIELEANKTIQMAYHQNLCYKWCYQDLIVLKCNCTDPSLPLNVARAKQKMHPCFNQAEVVCMRQTKALIQATIMDDKCSDECPIECLSTFYSISATMGNYPSQNYVDLLASGKSVVKQLRNKEISRDVLRESILKVNIFYEDMTYTAITESPALSWDILLGNIGGMFSLLLNLNMVAVAELCEFAVEAVLIFMRNFNLFV